MVRQLHALPSNLNHISSGLRPDEAAAVLSEMQRQAEHRLLDACREFQDIAFEMEWRITSWQQLVEQRNRLTEEGERIAAVPGRFNVAARPRKGRVPRSAAWQRLARAHKRRLASVEIKVAECAAAIMARNEEGRYLEEEILLLQDRVTRIAAVLAALPRRRPRLAGSGDDDDTAALARLGLELSLEPDVADLDIILTAFLEVEQRRSHKAARSG